MLAEFTFQLPLVYVVAGVHGLVLLIVLTMSYLLIRTKKTVKKITKEAHKNTVEALALKKQLSELAAWLKITDAETERKIQEIEKLTNRCQRKEDKLQEMKRAELERLFPLPWRTAYEHVCKLSHEDAREWFKTNRTIISSRILPALSPEATQKFMGELTKCFPGTRPYEQILALFPKPPRDPKEQKWKHYLDDLGRSVNAIQGRLAVMKQGIGGDAHNASEEIATAERLVAYIQGNLQDIEDLERGK